MRAPRRRGTHRHPSRALCLMLGMALTVMACQANNGAGAAGDDFYGGETIELVVPFDTGGGTDTIARFLAPVLSDHIPGKPDIQVINRPGADTLIGHNDFAARETDGLSMFLGGGTGNVNYIFGNSDAKFDYADWDAYLGVPQGAVVYVSPTTGISKPSDLTRPKEPLVWAAGSPEGSDLARLFTGELLGLDFNVNFGYSGSGPERIAFEQGESNVNVETTTSYVENVEPLVKDRKAVPMYSQGQIDSDGKLVRDPAVPDLPDVVEVYEQLHGSPPSGMELKAHRLLTSATAVFNKILFMHADAPKEAKQALRTGIEGMLDDSRYDKAVDTVLGGYDIAYGSGFDSTFDEIIEADPAVVDWVTAWAKRTYKSRLGS